MEAYESAYIEIRIDVSRCESVLDPTVFRTSRVKVPDRTSYLDTVASGLLNSFLELSL